ncbi:glycoside hydrolase family 15 protein [Nocardia sp. AB354]|uniref:glycoside hydrolase family 15 protein n=1 Tax=Nocardia sp. AB354 TaxID=3413283 RepID=UPI003C1CA3D7
MRAVQRPPRSTRGGADVVARDIERPHVLRDYAFIGDGERGGLIGPRGDLCWLCAPQWDSDAVFATLIGGRGVYSVEPVGRYVWGGYYEPGSLIWVSHWVVGSSVVECEEALALPSDPHRTVVLRRIRAVRGEAAVRVTLEPAAEFGRRAARELHRDADGRWHARLGTMRMRWTGAAEAAVDESGGASRLIHQIRLRPGQTHDLILELSDTSLPATTPDAGRMWSTTRSVWAAVVEGYGHNTAGKGADRALAVLHGLTSATGGMVAAATTSLPEHANRGENYDYRYVWIRDQCLAGQAVAAAGPHRLLDAAVSFVGERLLTDGPALMPAYTTRGTPVPHRHDLDLPGYPGAPTTVGNPARDQFQLDAFGEALLLFAAAGRYDILTTDARKAVSVAVSVIAQCWHQPDAGIWELDDRLWTHSRLICVAGLRAVAAAPATGADAQVCTTLADRIYAATAASCRHSGRWQRATDLTQVDAALLLPIIRGGVPHDDPATLATFRAIEQQLSTDYLVYRFRHDDQPLARTEGTFLLCGFAMALAADHLGDRPRALRYYDRNRTACGTPGLFAEEFDAQQNQLRGNLPQAFVHALMFETSVRLRDANHPRL